MLYHSIARRFLLTIDKQSSSANVQRESILVKMNIGISSSCVSTLTVCFAIEAYKLPSSLEPDSYHSATTNTYDYAEVETKIIAELGRPQGAKIDSVI